MCWTFASCNGRHVSSIRPRASLRSSITSKSRQRFSAEEFEGLFKHVVQLCKEKGLISGDYYFLDSSIIRADASKESFRTKAENGEGLS